MIDKTVPRIIAGCVPFAALLAIMAALALADPSVRPSNSSEAFAEKGLVDVSALPAGIYRITGLWRFYWESFDPDPSTAASVQYAPFPGAWHTLPGLPRTGYASYGLTIFGLDPARRYALRVGHTLSASSLRINGKILAGAGTPGSNAEEEVPGWNTLVAQFSPLPDGSAEVLLNISNFIDRWGGSNMPVYIGEASLIYAMQDARKLSAAFASSILGILGLFFLALFMWRRKEKSFLWFSLLCILIGIRGMCYDDFVLLDLLPALPWPAFFRLGYLTFPLSLVCISWFLYSMFPSLVRRAEAAAASLPFIAYSVMIITLPVRPVALSLSFFQVLGIGFLVWTAVAVSRACARKLDGSWWVAAGFSAAAVMYVRDMLVSMWIISGMSMTHFGMAACLCIIALMGISRYSMSFRKAAAISAELQVMNRALKRFVPAELLGLLKKADPSAVMGGDAAETELAILSARVGSFPVSMEKMEPETVFRFLNEFLALVAPVVRDSGGFIARYDGDGLVALFPGGSDAALKCAVRLQSSVSGMNRAASGRQPISVSIGIDSGKLAVGALGDSVRLDGAILSDCIRCALKFETAARVFGARILINGAVFAGLSEPLAWFLRPVDRIETDGITSFLFEVYNNDSDTVRDLKWKTQGDLERAVFAYFGDDSETAKRHLSVVLQTFPDDPVARHYAQRLQMAVSI